MDLLLMKPPPPVDIKLLEVIFAVYR